MAELDPASEESRIRPIGSIDDLERGTPAWDGAWRGLAEHPLNAGLTRPCTAYYKGECWQYMGTGVKGHCFRHRFHPNTMKREVVWIPID